MATLLLLTLVLFLRTGTCVDAKDTSRTAQEQAKCAAAGTALSDGANQVIETVSFHRESSKHAYLAATSMRPWCC
jgi:hypothetical protein